MSKDIFVDAISRLDRSLSIANVSPEIIEQLKHPKQILEVGIPVRMDDGSMKVFVGYRVRHNDSLGPTKGGIRFHQNVTREEVMALAFWMTLKCSLVGLPFGGGKGGVTVNPKELSNLELERLSRGYFQRISDSVGPNIDIPAPDVYTNSMIMGWMMDEYSAIKREKLPGVITGKPIQLGGSLGRNDATGRGAYYCIKELEKEYNLLPANTTVAVQGFGNAGQSVANLLHKDGYKVVALSDSKGAIYYKEGLNIPKLIEAKENKKNLADVYCKSSVCNNFDGEKLTNEELLELDVDFLLPSALENQITKDNAANIKAKYIVELANGPVSADADEILEKNNKIIVPDILANAGGVIVSYFEWVQNNQGYYWEQEDVHTKLQTIITKAHKKVFDLAKKENIPHRVAANSVALIRLGDAISSLGTKEYFTG